MIEGIDPYSPRTQPPQYGVREAEPEDPADEDPDAETSRRMENTGEADAKRTLVLSSGTHGVEGFAGSGIQTGLLNGGIGSRLPKGVNLLMIHGVNPFGMAHHRRTNEDNVDLNRNFRNHGMPYPGNVPYEDLADVVAPRSMSFLSELISWSRLLLYRITAGKAASQAAVSGG